MTFHNGNGAEGVLPAKQARSQRRQRAILDAAHRLLESVGYEKMKMEQIASEADSSVGTLYQRFSNKEGLLDALLSETLQQLDQIMSTELTLEALSSADRTDIIRKLIGIVVDFMRENQGFVRAITSRQLRDPMGVTPLQAAAREAVMKSWTAIASADPQLDGADVQLRFAFGMQLAIGAATNAVLNRPGPLLIDDPRLPDALTAMVDRLLMEEELPL